MDSNFTLEEECAHQLDQEDPLSHFRSKFYIPPDTIYFDGNSLGLLSKESEISLLRVIDEWKKLAIEGWLGATRPWFYFGETLGEIMAPLVGAQPQEVIATGTTTINIHSLISTFYHPTGQKTKILADELNFPSDLYALQGQVKMKGLNPKDHLVLAPSQDGKTLDEKHIVELMTEDIALIFLPSALYRSAQLLDIPYLTKEAHKRNIPIGFDCCHTVGVVPHYFNKWEVDFACWCSYKYMNAGPGSTAFLYINQNHFNREPLLRGWFGYVKEKQFELNTNFEHNRSAGGWQISSSNILCAGGVEGALKITHDAGIQKIREKSLNLTAYLIYLVDQTLSEEPYNFGVCTPRNPDQRTGHVALEHKHALEISEGLRTRRIITDFRPPNLIRAAPVALYNTYHEVWQFVQVLKEMIDKKEYE